MSPLPTVQECLEAAAYSPVAFETVTISITATVAPGTLMETRRLLELRCDWQGLPKAVRDGLELHLMALMAVSPTWGGSQGRQADIDRRNAAVDAAFGRAAHRHRP